MGGVTALSVEMLRDAARRMREWESRPTFIVVSPREDWSIRFFYAHRRMCRGWGNTPAGRLVTCPSCAAKVRKVRGRIRWHLVRESAPARAARIATLRAIRDEGATSGWWTPGAEKTLRREQAA